MKTLISRLMIFALMAGAAFGAQSDLNAQMERVERGLLNAVVIKGDPGYTIQDRMKHYKVPGVSVAVIKDFKIIWSKAYGVADVETNQPVTLNTLFQAGSISKPVAAMVALKKVEQGKLALDENINDRLTSWKLPDNEFTAKKKVTLANLLSHTAGLTVHGFPGYAMNEKLPTVPQVLDGAAPANTAAVRVNMEPGTKFRYSGGGTTIMQLALTDIEKRPFPEIAEKTVLKPLDMKSSTYSQPLPADLQRLAATGHRANGRPVEGKFHVYPEMAAAGLWTTPADLAKFAIEVQLSLAGKSNKVLSKEMTQRMLTPYVEDFITLGFFLDKRGGATYFGHGGADAGFRAQLVAHKEKGYGAVVMVNSDNGQIIEEIIRSIAKEYAWEDYLPQPREALAVDATKLDRYTGRFQVNPDRVLTFTREGSRLFVEPTQSPRLELVALSETRFIRKDADVQYEFAAGADGKADQLTIYFSGQTAPARRLPAGALIPYEMLLSGKIEQAIQGYRKIKSATPNSGAVAEERLNTLGYFFINEKKYDEAIAVLSLNAEFYPSSWNVYDSLGEAYMMKGDKEAAIRNYKRSVEMNPNNKAGLEMLRKLQQ